MSDKDRDEAIRASIRERVLRRAATDLDFRRLLIDNPKSAIARELGIDIPDAVHVTVLPETENHVFIVIPPQSQTDISDGAGTGVERLAGVNPAYGGGGGSRPTPWATGLDKLGAMNPAYGGGGGPANPMATGLDRLGGVNPAYGGGGGPANPMGTGLDRLGGVNPAYGGQTRSDK